MAWDLKSKVIECLKENIDKQFTAREIAEWIWDKYSEACQDKLNRSTNAVVKDQASLIQQLIAEITSSRLQLQKKDPNVKTMASRPRKYYYTTQSDEAVIEEEAENKIEEKENNQEKSTLPSEHDLYPIFIEYLYEELKLYPKRIDERCSHNTMGPKGNKWLYPDIVALEDLSLDWDDNIKKCTERDDKTRLWSFEVKRIINSANVREAFFQAVSNSSWANLGYLVAAELNENAQKELKMLADLHGIGFILMNIEDVSESQIIFPARESKLDWESINRLSKANKDFKKYLKEVHDFWITGSTKDADWDCK